MKPEVAKLIHKEWHTFAQQALEIYVQERIDTLHKEMETASKDDFQTHQGAIAELRLILKAKDYAIRILDNGKS